MTISSGRDATMAENDPLSPSRRKPRVTRKKVEKVGKKAARLTGREYLPMLATIGFWAVVALGIGHADAARLLAATVLMRAPLMLSQMTTSAPLRRRYVSTPQVWKASRRTAALIQLGVLGALALQVAVISMLLGAVHQDMVAMMLPLVALGLPAKLHRQITPRLSSHYARLYLGLATLAMGGGAWALGAGPLGFALAYGLRDWLASAMLALVPVPIPVPERTSDEPLTFGEVAKTTVVTSRRLMTYRLTKNVLTVFGPFGNFAARTGRGLNLHGKLEPYMPHKKAGFALFAIAAFGLAVFLVWHSGKPLAMIAGAGAMQLAALALNVILWWRYLPRRDDDSLVIEDEDDD